MGLRSIVYMHNLLINQKNFIFLFFFMELLVKTSFVCKHKSEKYNLKNTYQCVILEVIHIYHIVFVSDESCDISGLKVSGVDDFMAES